MGRRGTACGGLRAAQLELLRQNRADHDEALPATWGAFLLEGS